MRSEPTLSADPQPESDGGSATAPMGAIFGASLGVVLAALLDVSAPLAFDGGVSPSSMARNGLIGALVGAVGGYAAKRVEASLTGESEARASASTLTCAPGQARLLLAREGSWPADAVR